MPCMGVACRTAAYARFRLRARGPGSSKGMKASSQRIFNTPGGRPAG